MNFEVLIPHREDVLDSCHYLDVTETRLECDLAVDPECLMFENNNRTSALRGNVREHVV